MEVLGYILALGVGLSLGLIGGGGSILTLPILVYVMGIERELGTAYSLFIVGSTALFSGLQYVKQKKVELKTAAIFGIPSIITVYLTRAFVVPQVPDPVIHTDAFTLDKATSFMLLFSVIMLLAAYKMLKSGKKKEDVKEQAIEYNYPMILLEGIVVGLLTGFVGAGGGFLIVPALVLFARLPMRLAVGTSLMIIASNALIGFIGDIQTRSNIDWKLITLFSAISIGGGFLGNRLSRKFDNTKLKHLFAWFVLIMGLIILFNELFK